jgi:asparagine synthase (glutamine-hydrolysing)
MCGFITLYSSNEPWNKSTLRKGSYSMSNRGPDGSGEWWSDDNYVGIRHNRLSIIDLNDRSIQPMISINKRYIIAFNGEIYNYKKLRDELLRSGVNLLTQSDTEVLLELFSLYREDCLSKISGMFAFSIWDNHEKKLFIARDPYGIKPLYYAKISKGYVVASQVKAIISTEVVDKSPCPHGQGGYWLLGSVPEPYTWYKNIKSLPAGSYMWIDGEESCIKSWYSLPEIWDKDGIQENKKIVEKKVNELIYQSVERHLVSDVPIGIFLSGGIDSTSLLAIIDDIGKKNVVGITLKYSEFESDVADESEIAKYIAKKYDVKHHIKTVTRSEFENDMPEIFNSMDQPSIDGVNTWYASKCAAEIGLKVAISGAGGDELFQGYRSFKILPTLVKYRNIFSKIPGVDNVISLIANKQAIKSGNARWNHFESLSKTLPGAWLLNRSVFPIEELKFLMGDDLYNEFTQNYDPISFVLGMTGGLPKNNLLALSQIESMCYLRNQLLRDGDWASMCHGVELRMPLVDSLLLKELGPYMNSFSKFPKKSLLSNAPKIPLDNFIKKKKKTGFGIPVNKWIKEIYPKLNSSSDNKIWPLLVAKKTYEIK